MTRRQKRFGARPEAAAERVAGGGLLHRRTLLTAGAVATGAIAAGRVGTPAAQTGSLEVPPWMQVPGRPFSGYGLPSKYEEHVQRSAFQPYGDMAPASGASFTPVG